MLTKDNHRAPEKLPPSAGPTEKDVLRAVARRQVKRVRRLKINAAAWVLGTIAVTGLWVLNQWQANGAFEHFGSHEGNPGDWNPTLWALIVGIWGLIVGIMALRVYFERPTTEAKNIRRLKFHVAAWVLGMTVLTPLWALIEWQDNGGFERWSNNSQPGAWEPWILYIGGVWAFGIAILALKTHFERPTTEVEIDREVERMRR
jgi:hypothetical protein